MLTTMPQHKMADLPCMGQRAERYFEEVQLRCRLGGTGMTTVQELCMLQVQQRTLRTLDVIDVGFIGHFCPVLGRKT